MKIESREVFWDHLLMSLTELLAGRGEALGEVTRETQLSADLGISSVEVIHLLVLLEDVVGQPLDFQELAVRDGEYVQELSVGELMDFVCKTLNLA